MVRGFAKLLWRLVIPESIRGYLYGKRYLWTIKYYDWCKFNNQRTYADYLYRKTFGYGIDWKHPRDLNEIINVLAFTTDTSQWSLLADKYRVRSFVKERGCEEILIPLLGKWDRVEDIDWNNLPDTFVLKCNNGYGDVTIIKDKNKADLDSIGKKFHEALHSHFGLETAEVHYLKIMPCIIAEPYLESGDNGLVDYKVWCFNGAPYCILTCSNRDMKTHQCDLNLFDTNWKQIDIFLSMPFRNDHFIARPKLLDKMLEYARILSFGFPQVRIDMYEVNDRIYFGEMTFTSACGRMEYFTPNFLKQMGSQIEL